MGRRGGRGGTLHGLAVVDKAAGWTSHDTVARARRVLGERRVGHAGTLDPGATGVLLLGVGRVTRLLRFLTALPKHYEGELVLGTETTTLDDEGEVVATHDMSAVTAADVRAAAARFQGEIDQVPPMVSAVKVGGRRLHELARAGTEVERQARRVTVHRIDTAPTDDPLVHRLAVHCSSGTYVRTLAADIGRALGGGAHLRRLRRTAIGDFGLDTAVAVDDLTPEVLLPPVEAMRGHARVVVSEATAVAVGHGAVLERAALGLDGDGPWAILGPGGDLLAVYEARGADRAKPAVVLTPAG